MVGDAALPALSIIIPTLDEETAIKGLLSCISGDGGHELIVVDGGSADRTVEIAAGYARVIRSEACRAVQMNEGARAASGEVLLFLHADVLPGAGALDAVRRAMADPRVAGGNLDVRYEGGDFTAWAFTVINRWRGRWGVFYGDSGIFCRRSVFEALGGFRPWPILEDFEMARRLRKSGRLAMLREPLHVSARRWKKGGLFVTLWLWFWIQALYLAGVSPQRLAKWYRAVR
jgi:rSAM/selenodomain-associated transferase 2